MRPAGDEPRHSGRFYAELPFERNRDIVFIDQRGTRGSGSLDCEDLDDPMDLTMPRFSLPAVERCRDRLAHHADLTKYSTLDAVEDVEAVRRWLGYDPINVLGGSYGTRVILEYLRRHGAQVRTAILAGPVPPDFKRPLYYGRDGLEALRGITAACRQDGPCRRAFPDPLRQLDRVLHRLERAPAAVPWKHPKTGAAITLRIDRVMFADIVWEFLLTESAARKLPFVIARADGGDFAPLVEGSLMDGRLADHEPVEGMYLSVTCPEETLRIADSESGVATPDFLGSDRLKRQMNACRAWRQSSLPADFFEPVRTPVPAVIVAGALDPVTPTRWGRQLLETMPNARLINVPGAAHGLAGIGNSCRA